MSQVEARGFRLEKKYFFKIFNLLRVIGTDIVQRTVSIETVPLSILKYYAKNQKWLVFVYKVRPVSSTKTDETWW